ncbi:MULTISPECIES: MerR family transcriptional regulator [unclassified Streptomyces]|uniref:transcriptional regulator FtsR n=1 Tax=unclassified Streptomyces TaxID=2593676 RepID=UPI002E123310|nr:MerR family transcriptional regulator [Streptomyces sp. NBC_01197]WSS47916.1 MerR family transcriptional regulator [Streptomyces sp. NBC_01180]
MRQSSTGGAGDGTATDDDRLVSIGTVLNLLREEFPEVTISKIRFLEAEGLVEPQRTSSGYRKFGTADVERLAQVLRMQRDHYLPLKVIRDHLDALGRGEQIQLPAPGAVREPADGAPDGGAGGPTASRVGREELLAAAGISADDLAEWESYGLLSPLPEGGYDAEAVNVAGLVADLGRFGLEPRHLRAMKAAADRESGLIEQVVAPLRLNRNPQTRADADTTTKDLAALTVRLHAALVQTSLRVRLY